MVSRRGSCEVERLGFIGYAARRSSPPGRHVVRIFINCEPTADLAERQLVNDPTDLVPPPEIRFLHTVDVIFEDSKCRFIGLDTLSAIRKFHRFMGALGGRAREMGHGHDWPFESPRNLVDALARIKNSRDFS